MRFLSAWISSLGSHQAKDSPVTSQLFLACKLGSTFISLSSSIQFWIVSVLHQNEWGFGKSIPDGQKVSQDPRDLRRAKPEGKLKVWRNLEDGGDEFPNTSQVLVGWGHSPHHQLLFRKSIPLGREGLTVLKSILPCWGWKNGLCNPGGSSSFFVKLEFFLNLVFFLFKIGYFLKFVLSSSNLHIFKFLSVHLSLFLAPSNSPPLNPGFYQQF